MRFKSSPLETQWKTIPPPAPLRKLLEKADIYRTSLDKGELTLTCYIDQRPGKPSYHPLARAVDIRVHGMTEEVRLKVLAFMKLVAEEMNTGELAGTGNKLDVVEHKEMLGTPHAHFHIEFDNGKPYRPGDDPPTFAEVTATDGEFDGA